MNYLNRTDSTDGTIFVGVERYYDDTSSINNAHKNDDADHAVKQSCTDSKDSVASICFAGSARRQSEASVADSVENADDEIDTDGVEITHNQKN